MMPRIGYRPVFELGGTAAPAAPAAARSGQKLKTEFIKPGRPKIIKKILIVDDQPNVISAIQRAFKCGALKEIEVIGIKNPTAPTHDQIEDAMREHPDIDMTIMDGKLKNTSGGEETEKLRGQGYAGLIVGNSDNIDNNNVFDELIARGVMDFKNPSKLNSLSQFFKDMFVPPPAE